MSQEQGRCREAMTHTVGSEVQPQPISVMIVGLKVTYLEIYISAMYVEDEKK
jgi:hypothetical protein